MLIFGSKMTFWRGNVVNFISYFDYDIFSILNNFSNAFYDILFSLGCDSLKKRFIEKSIQLIKSQRKLSNIEEKKMRYGLEAFYNFITKLLVLIILSIMFHLVLELFLLSLIYSTMRLYGFGLHAKTSLQCWITTLPVYLGGCLLIKYLVIPNSISIIIWIFGFLSFLLFAPADTPARPLIHQEKRIRAKVLSIFLLLVYLVLYIYDFHVLLNNTIIYALLMESISINPLTYKITGTTFNNYKNFQKTMV